MIHKWDNNFTSGRVQLTTSNKRHVQPNFRVTYLAFSSYKAYLHKCLVHQLHPEDQDMNQILCWVALASLYDAVTRNSSETWRNDTWLHHHNLPLYCPQCTRISGKTWHLYGTKSLQRPWFESSWLFTSQNYDMRGKIYKHITENTNFRPTVIQKSFKHTSKSIL